MLVYIAHPISGDVENNVKKVKLILEYIIRNEPGITPIAPYLTYLEILDDNNEFDRSKGMQHDLNVLRRCEQIWVYGISGGVKQEIEFASVNGLLIKFKEMENGL